MTSKGFFQALGSGAQDEGTNVQQKQQGAPTEGIPSQGDQLALPQSTWLSRLGVNHRRSSMGFSMGTSMHEHDEENSNSFNNMLTISKSTLGCETPSNHEAFGAFVEVTEDGKFKLEGLSAKGATDLTAGETITEHPLTEVLGTAINVSEFPVATQESLKQLEDMKMRLHGGSDQDADVQFEMDIDSDIPGIVVVDSEPGSRKTSSNAEPKPSALLTNIMQSGFAQNWFFKNDDHPATVKEEPFTRTAFMDSETENANFPNVSSATATTSKQKKSFSGLLETKQQQQKKRENRESNVFTPQHF